jgi:hypothetical protein
MSELENILVKILKIDYYIFIFLIKRERNKEYIQCKTKYMEEIDKKNTELNEFKIHLEKLQKFTL